jgi:hypothetical protein
MSKRQWLCLLGVWVMIFLFLGFPSFWHKIIALVSGVIIIAIAYNIPAEIKKNNNESAMPPSSSAFIENDNGISK